MLDIARGEQPAKVFDKNPSIRFGPAESSVTPCRWNECGFGYAKKRTVIRVTAFKGRISFLTFNNLQILFQNSNFERMGRQVQTVRVITHENRARGVTLLNRKHLPSHFVFVKREAV